jgi:GT2 family glycosyltransferase
VNDGKGPQSDPAKRPDAAGDSYCVGIINHHSYAELQACLLSIAGQSHAPSRTFVLDADAEPETLAALRRAHREVDFEAIANLGYAAGANRFLARVDAEGFKADFCLLLNPDVILDRDFAERLLAAIQSHPDVALATGKLLRPDREILDSAGIDLPRNRRPRDRGGEEKDLGQYERAEYVFGASGAALLMRRSALSELALDGEIFDEDFFAYHEDTDLCWRSHLLGWRVYYEPSARAVHVRGWQRNRRFEIPLRVRRHSFKNHYLELIKNESGAGLLRILPVLLCWEVLRLGFALFRDPGILPAYLDALRLSPRAFRKRALLAGKRARADARPPRRIPVPTP